MAAAAAAASPVALRTAHEGLGRATALLREESGAAVTVAEAVPWGVRLAVGGGPVPAAERAAAEADLRARCHARLRAAGLLEGFAGLERS